MVRVTLVEMTVAADDREGVETPNGQGLYGEETHPNAKTQGIFDVSLEEVLHQVTDKGSNMTYSINYLYWRGLCGPRRVQKLIRA